MWKYSLSLLGRGYVLQAEERRLWPRMCCEGWRTRPVQLPIRLEAGRGPEGLCRWDFIIKPSQQSFETRSHRYFGNSLEFFNMFLISIQNWTSSSETTTQRNQKHRFAEKRNGLNETNSTKRSCTGCVLDCFAVLKHLLVYLAHLLLISRRGRVWGLHKRRLWAALSKPSWWVQLHL